VGLDYAAQGSLRVGRHTVCLVQNHNLQLRHNSAVRVLCNLPLSELLYLFSDHLDATLVRRVQFQHSLPVEILAEQLLCEGQNS
jgi:hypothetical protein